MKEKILFCWSSGKDSAQALYEILKSDKYEVVSLLTTICEDNDRISHHGVHRTLLEKQADSIGIPLHQINIKASTTDDEYRSKMEEHLLEFKKAGIEKVAFGDIFLEDLRKYREDNLAKVGMTGIFPLWKQGSKELAKKFIDSGFKSIVVAVNSNVLDKSFAGRIFDDSFLSDLPENIDPCGENGEFHTFVFDGSIFKNEIKFKTGEILLKDGLYFIDLKPFVDRRSS